MSMSLMAESKATPEAALHLTCRFLTMIHKCSINNVSMLDWVYRVPRMFDGSSYCILSPPVALSFINLAGTLGMPWCAREAKGQKQAGATRTISNLYVANLSWCGEPHSARLSLASRYLFPFGLCVCYNWECDIIKHVWKCSEIGHGFDPTGNWGQTPSDQYVHQSMRPEDRECTVPHNHRWE